jgi:hypothetical protein
LLTCLVEDFHHEPVALSDGEPIAIGPSGVYLGYQEKWYTDIFMQMKLLLIQTKIFGQVNICVKDVHFALVEKIGKSLMRGK